MILPDALLKAKRKLLDMTHALPGFQGVGSDGEQLRIYVSDPQINASIPRKVDGYSVQIVTSGQIRAQLPRTR